MSRWIIYKHSFSPSFILVTNALKSIIMQNFLEFFYNAIRAIINVDEQLMKSITNKQGSLSLRQEYKTKTETGG